MSETQTSVVPVESIVGTAPHLATYTVHVGSEVFECTNSEHAKKAVQWIREAIEADRARCRAADQARIKELQSQLQEGFQDRDRIRDLEAENARLNKNLDTVALVDGMANDERRSQAERIRDLEAEIDGLQKVLVKNNQTIQDQASELAAGGADTDNAKQKKRITELEAENKEIVSRMASLEHENNELKNGVDAQLLSDLREQNKMLHDKLQSSASEAWLTHMKDVEQHMEDADALADLNTKVESLERRVDKHLSTWMPKAAEMMEVNEKLVKTVAMLEAVKTPDTREQRRWEAAMDIYVNYLSKSGYEDAASSAIHHADALLDALDGKGE